MANLDFNNQGTGLADLATNGKNLNTTLSLLVTVLQDLFPRVTGTFTMPVAASVTVTNSNVQANTIVQWAPINASAGTLEGSNEALWQDMSATVAGTSFTLKTAAGTAAAGTEQFAYWFITPV